MWLNLKLYFLHLNGNPSSSGARLARSRWQPSGRWHEAGFRFWWVVRCGGLGGTSRWMPQFVLLLGGFCRSSRCRWMIGGAVSAESRAEDGRLLTRAPGGSRSARRCLRRALPDRWKRPSTRATSSSCASPSCREPRNPGESPLLAWKETPTPARGKELSPAGSSSRKCAAGAHREWHARRLPRRLPRSRARRFRTAPSVSRSSSFPELRRAPSRSAGSPRRVRVSTSDRCNGRQPADDAAALPDAGDALAALLLARGGGERRGRDEDEHSRVPRRCEPDARGVAHGSDMPARGRAWVEPAADGSGGSNCATPGARRVMVVWCREDSRIERWFRNGCGNGTKIPLAANPRNPGRRHQRRLAGRPRGARQPIPTSACSRSIRRGDWRTRELTVEREATA